MRFPRKHPSPIQALAAEWFFLSKWAIAFARIILRMDGAGKPGAAKAAETLEIWTYLARCQLLRQIAALEASEEAHRPEEAAALSQLRAFAVSLTQISLICALLKTHLPARGCPESVWALACDGGDLPDWNGQNRPTGLRAYIDTS